MFNGRGPNDRPRARRRIVPLALGSALVAVFVSPGPAGAADVTGPGANKLASVVSATVEPDRQGVLVPGQLVTMTGTVASAEKGNGAKGTAIPTGKVHVVVNGLASNGGPTAAVDEAGRFTLPEFSMPLVVNPSKPVYPAAVTVAYDGDATFASSASAGTKLSVYPSDSVTSLTVDQSSAPFGEAVTFQARVSGVAPLGQPRGTVSFSVDGIPRSGVVALDKDGKAAWVSSMDMGNHVVSATYVPVASAFSASKAQLKQVITPPARKLPAQLTVVPVPLKGSTIGFRFSGELRPPDGLPRRGACAGTVRIVLVQARNRVGNTAAVAGDCRYATSISFPAGAKVGAQSTVKATATFSGNHDLEASQVPVAMSLYAGRVSNLHPSAPSSSTCQNWHLGCHVAPWVVTLGDSYMAGEGGRWAGNTNGYSGLTDALSSNAYNDNLTNSLNPPGPHGSPVAGTSEVISGCHRSRAEEAFIGGPKGLNLACSGAMTGSYSTTWTGPLQFKPGIDFSSAGPEKGQALLMSEFASAPSRKVNMVVLGIGGNDYGFGDILATCVTDYLTSQNRTTQSWHWEWSWSAFSWHKVDEAPVDHRAYCSEDSDLTDRFTPTKVAIVTAKVTTAIHNAAQALANQGYGRNDYTIVVQMAPVPVASSATIRYGQGDTFKWLDPATWVSKPRQTIGGCGFWDKDINWMTTFVVGKFNATSWQAVQNAKSMNVIGSGGVLYKPRVEILDVEGAFKGHLLCQGATPNGPNPDVVTNAWTTTGSVNRAEWVTQLRLLPSIFSNVSPYALQEGLHPNYWGHLALRACVRLAYNHGQPKSGKCVRTGLGLNTAHSPAEPNMGLN